MNSQLLTTQQNVSEVSPKPEIEKESRPALMHSRVASKREKHVGRRLSSWQLHLIGLAVFIGVLGSVVVLPRRLIPFVKEPPEIAFPPEKAIQPFKGWEALPAISVYEQRLSAEEKLGKQVLADAVVWCKKKEVQPSQRARQQLAALALAVTSNKTDQLLGRNIKLEHIRRFGKTDEESAPGADSGVFKVTRFLGEGSSALVLELLQESTNERLAMKIPIMATANPGELMELLADGGLELIENEERSMLKIAGGGDAKYAAVHKGAAVPLYTATLAGIPETVSVGNVCVYNRLQLMEGFHSDMERVLSSTDRKLPEEAMEYIAKRLLLEVLHLHASGIIHNDLKWENLLLRSDGSFLLADFGSSCAAGETMGVLAGPNTLYAEPTLLLDHSKDDSEWEPLKPDPKGDLWSVGAMLYDLFTGGRLPYNMSEHEHSKEAVVQHMSNLLKGEAKPTSLFADDDESISSRWKELLCRLLEPERAKRISSTEVLQMFPDIVGLPDK